MHQTRVKICGITRVQDALCAAEHGADAIGLVFYARSPRNIDIARAQQICRELPAFVTTVALFKDADAATINTVLDAVPIDLLQFHGSEPARFCTQFSRPWIKALGMAQSAEKLVAEAEQYRDARGLLLDSHAPGEDGGSGLSFDWSSIPPLPKPLILAGGLRVDNVAEAVKIVKPWAVDVSSGVESEKGLKDAALIAAFMQTVRLTNG
ncbi:MAG: phosphoribosylanthranilate isomerase [Gammaproteobacteria bacterium]